MIYFPYLRRNIHKMKTIIIDYPTDFVFRTRIDFVSDEQRTKHLRKILRKNNVSSPLHEYNDYVVEIVEDLDSYTEFWIVGS